MRLASDLAVREDDAVGVERARRRVERPLPVGGGAVQVERRCCGPAHLTPFAA